MDTKDVLDTYGRIKPVRHTFLEPSLILRQVASSAQQLSWLAPPALNYTGGATIFAAFDLGGTYEVFAAVGRPGADCHGCLLLTGQIM